MASKRAYCMAFLNGPATMEAEWNEWLNKTHLPSCLKLPGVLSGRRFMAARGDLKYFHMLGLADADVLSSKPFQQLRDKERSKGDPSYPFATMTDRIPGAYRGVYEQIFPEGDTFGEPKADAILVVGIDVPRGKDKEFNAWYNTEHIPGHLQVPGLFRAHRFMEVRKELSPGRKATGTKYIALYELDSEKVLQSQAYVTSRRSPWTDWIRTWYKHRFRLEGRRIF